MRAIGLLAATVQVAAALGIAAIASQRSFPNPPQEVPRGFALLVVFVIPAAIGVLGAVAPRRSLLVAAAACAAAGSVVGFGGETLIFLVPAVLFAAAAGQNGSRSRPTTSLPRLLLLVALAFPVAGLAVLTIGIFAVPGFIVLLAVIEAGRGSLGPALRSRLPGAVAGLVIVVLTIGAGLALFSITETRCWRAYRTPSGVVYERVPDNGEISLPATAIAGGCDGGEQTILGAGVAGLLDAAAIGLALVVAGIPSRRP